MKLTDHDAICLFSAEKEIKHDSIDSISRTKEFTFKVLYT